MSYLEDNEDCKDWTACYLPSRPPGKEDPSRSGFKTYEAATEHIISNMCSSCQEERKAALAGDEDSDKYPGCFYEWIIYPSDSVKEDSTLHDMMNAAGLKIIYTKEKGKIEV